jgi:hypothetical protein
MSHIAPKELGFELDDVSYKHLAPDGAKHEVAEAML